MKILFITPHLSTGGCPQYLFKKIEALKNDHEIYCIEYADITGGILVVQRNKIQNVLGKNLITLHENKYELLDHINKIQPDIIHFEEMPEYFCEDNLAIAIYETNRKYKIIETSHDSSFDPLNKKVLPDAFAFVSEYQKRNLECLNVPSHIVEYPIEYKNKTNREAALLELHLDPQKTHFLNVGLFTSRKNQKEIIEYAKKLLNEPVQFHFVGNQAENFKWYWEPLMKDFPANCKWWGERSDVDTFYNAMDVFLFTSRGTDNDKETSPLVLREALGWKMPILMYNLPVYLGMYNKYKNITWLDTSAYKNIEIIKSKVVTKEFFDVDCRLEGPNKLIFKNLGTPFKCLMSVRDNATKVPIYFCNFDFTATDSWWAIPSMNTDYTKEEFLNEFLIEFYDDKKNLKISKVLKFKERTYTPIKVDCDFGPFDCFYNNYREMFYEDIYAPFDLKDMKTVIDIGANAGLFSLYMLNNNCECVYAIEPTSKAFGQLKKNLSKYKKAKLHNIAIYNKKGKMDITFTDSNSTISGFNLENIEAGMYDERNNSEEVEVDTLCNFIKENDIANIDLIKIDVEGAEYDIIDSLSDDNILLSKNYLIEYHGADNKNTHNRLLGIISRFKNLEYKIFNYKDPKLKYPNSFFLAAR